MQTKTTPLKDRAARLEQELAAVSKVAAMLESLREVFVAFPGLREPFAAELQLLASGSTAQAANGNGESILPDRPERDTSDQSPDDDGEMFLTGTNRERIEAYLDSRNNKPATVEMIRHATGIPDASIRHLFSTRYPDAFEAVEVQGSRLKHWKKAIETEEGANDLFENDRTAGGDPTAG